VPEPPFNVVGVELRGGERFLSVTAPKASSVLDVWLLREGDAVGAWHLLAIECAAVSRGRPGPAPRRQASMKHAAICFAAILAVVAGTASAQSAPVASLAHGARPGAEQQRRRAGRTAGARLGPALR
jgi:hypothetical protein